MQQTFNFTTHEASINHLSSDYYGKRIASSSNDNTIKFYEKTKDNIWAENTDLQVNHDCPVVSCCFAHPEFGTYIAVLGLDHSVSIYNLVEMTAGSTELNSTHWLKTCIISQKKVKFVAFVGQEFTIRARENTELLGLFLVLATNEGEIHFYKSANLAEIGNLKEMTDQGGQLSVAGFCGSQLKQRLENKTNEENKNLSLPAKNNPETTNTIPAWSPYSIKTIDFSKSWNRNSHQLLAIGLDNESDDEKNLQNKLQIFYLENSIFPGDWKNLNLNLEAEVPNVNSPITDLVFAKTCGRTFHLLAIASDQGLVCIKIYSLSEETTPKIIKCKNMKLNGLEEMTNINRLARSVKFNSNGQILSCLFSNGKLVVFELDSVGDCWNAVNCY